MGALSRRKGATGERELRRLLEAELGVEIVRNLDQTRDGGHDLLGLPWAIECKRVRRATRGDLAAWWAQTVAQADRAGLRPVLCYREDRGEWLVVLHLADLHPGFERWPGFEWTATITVHSFCAVAREANLGSSQAVSTAGTARRAAARRMNSATYATRT